jgi:hypothetical protein
MFIPKAKQETRPDQTGGYERERERERDSY